MFLLFLLISLGITLPASLVLQKVTLDKKLTLGAVTGPWWSFNVAWLSYNQFTQENTRVSLNLSCLVTASICIDLENAQGTIHLGKALLNDDFSLENSHFKINFIDLNPLLKNLLVKPSGMIELKIDSLVLNKNILKTLSGDIYWHSVGVEGETFDLGTVQAKLSHQAKQINLKLLDQSDKLDLTGLVKINSNGLIDSNVQLKTLASFPSSVKTVVESMMRKRGRDVFAYKAKISNSLIKRLKVKF